LQRSVYRFIYRCIFEAIIHLSLHIDLQQWKSSNEVRMILVLEY